MNSNNEMNKFIDLINQDIINFCKENIYPKKGIDGITVKHDKINNLTIVYIDEDVFKTKVIRAVNDLYLENIFTDLLRFIISKIVGDIKTVKYNINDVNISVRFSKEQPIYKSIIQPSIDLGLVHESIIDDIDSLLFKINSTESSDIVLSILEYQTMSSGVYDFNTLLTKILCYDIDRDIKIHVSPNNVISVKKRYVE